MRITFDGLTKQQQALALQFYRARTGDADDYATVRRAVFDDIDWDSDTGEPWVDYRRNGSVLPTSERVTELLDDLMNCDQRIGQEIVEVLTGEYGESLERCCSLICDYCKLGMKREIFQNLPCHRDNDGNLRTCTAWPIRREFKL